MLIMAVSAYGVSRRDLRANALGAALEVCCLMLMKHSLPTVLEKIKPIKQISTEKCKPLKLAPAIFVPRNSPCGVVRQADWACIANSAGLALQFFATQL